MGTPLSRVLLDFGAARGLEPAPQPSLSIVPPCDPADDLARQVSEAFARGADEARLAADAEHEHVLAQALARLREEHAAERARWARDEADELAQRLEAAAEALETRIGDAVGRVLAPFLTAELRRKSVEALADSIGTILSGASRPPLRIGGPEDLLAALRERLGPGAGAVDWQPNGGVEVTVISDDTIIETEIQGWMDRLAEARP